MFARLRRPRSPAGRWASPSTATPSPRSRRSPTSRSLQGNIGKPGAGLCPVRGHSNVQGDRTMGIWERPPTHFLDALADGVRLRPAARARPRHRRRRSGRCATARPRSSSALGGNFVAAAPDTDVTEAAMRDADLTVQVSTKLNRSHVVPRPRRR